MSFVERLREYARRHTLEDRYSPVGQLFHWIMTAVVIFQIWWGWRVGRLPVGPEKLDGYGVHSQVGLALLMLVLLRGLWRLMIPGPVNDADKPGWESQAAHLTHYAFYAILIGLPLSGWAMWSSGASDLALSIGGALPWPQLPFEGLSRETRWTILRWANLVHVGLVWALLLLIVLHVGAALKHHFVDQDDVLAGMVPFLEPLRKRQPDADWKLELERKRGLPSREASPRSETPPGSPAPSAPG